MKQSKHDNHFIFTFISLVDIFWSKWKIIQLKLWFTSNLCIVSKTITLESLKSRIIFSLSMLNELSLSSYEFVLLRTSWSLKFKRKTTRMNKLSSKHLIWKSLKIVMTLKSSKHIIFYSIRCIFHIVRSFLIKILSWNVESLLHFNSKKRRSLSSWILSLHFWISIQNSMTSSHSFSSWNLLKMISSLWSSKLSSLYLSFVKTFCLSKWVTFTLFSYNNNVIVELQKIRMSVDWSSSQASSSTESTWLDLQVEDLDLSLSLNQAQVF